MAYSKDDPVLEVWGLLVTLLTCILTIVLSDLLVAVLVGTCLYK